MRSRPPSNHSKNSTKPPKQKVNPMISLTGGDSNVNRKLELKVQKQNTFEHSKESESLDNSFDANDRAVDTDYLNSMKLKLKNNGPEQFKKF